MAKKTASKKVAKKPAKGSSEQDLGRLVGIFSYIPIVGWILALVLNLNSKTKLGSFHIRQALLLHLAWFLLIWIPVIGWIIAVVIIILGIMGLVSAINGKEKEVPIIGPTSQQWFKGL